MVVDFKGSPPHDLGTAELATIQTVNGNIEVTLHILDDWHRPTAQIVRVQMAPALARSLAERLGIAAASPPG
jgi:hypothetical protein